MGQSRWIDTVVEVVEKVLDPARDSEDELACGAADDVIAVRDTAGEEDEVVGGGEPLLLTAVDVITTVKDVERLVDSIVHVEGNVIICRGVADQQTERAASRGGRSEERASGARNRPTVARSHDKARSDHGIRLRRYRA